MVNEKWLGMFPNIRAEFSSPNFFDHCARVLTWGLSEKHKAGAGPFNFFDFLTKRTNFLRKVEEVWHSSTIQGSNVRAK